MAKTLIDLTIVIPNKNLDLTKCNPNFDLGY